MSGWSYVAGKRGVNRVRAYERGGCLHVEWYPGGDRMQRSARSVFGEAVPVGEEGAALALWMADNYHLFDPLAADVGECWRADRGRVVTPTHEEADALAERIASMPDSQLLAHEIDCAPRAGVYLLLFRNRVVYVGKTTNVAVRVYVHGKQSPFRFDRVVFLEVPQDVASAVEPLLIERFRPIGNKNFNQEWSAA